MNEMLLWLVAAIVLAFGCASSQNIEAPDSACVNSDSKVTFEYKTVGSCVVSIVRGSVATVTQPPADNYGDCEISFSTDKPRALFVWFVSKTLRTGQTLTTKTAGGTEKVYSLKDLSSSFRYLPTASSSLVFSAGTGADRTQGSFTLKFYLIQGSQYTCSLQEGQYYDGLSRSSYDTDTYSQTWITAPQGCQLKYKVRNLRVGYDSPALNDPCTSDYVVFDTKGEPDYRPANSHQMCGRVISAGGTSQANKLNMALFGKRGSYYGFTVRVTVVRCTAAAP